MTPDPYSLSRLNDIVEPAAVPRWPPAAGFWFLLALVLVWVTAAVLLLLARYRSNAYRREGAATLRRIAPRLRSPDSRAEALAQVSELLKRTALAAFPRDQVALLSGADWLAFLDRTGGGDAFTIGPASIIATAPYRRSTATELSAEQQDAILAAARRWILRHRAPRSP